MNSIRILDRYTAYGRDGDWTLKRDAIAVREKTGEEYATEYIVGFWSNLQHVVEKIIRIEGESASSLQEYVERMEAAAQLIRQTYESTKKNTTDV